MKIAPSIAAADLSNLGRAVEEAEAGGADMIHLDIADGHFAPNITFGPGTVKALRRYTDLPFDTHLMLTDPLDYVERFLEAGSDIISPHAEVLDGRSFDTFSTKARRGGARVGLALRPETRLPSWARSRLDRLDVLLVMTVKPGFSGQKLIESVLPSIREYSDLKRELGLGYELEVDGGVEPQNVGKLVTRGATILVAGASAFRRGSVSDAINELKEKARESVVVR